MTMVEHTALPICRGITSRFSLSVFFQLQNEEPPPPHCALPRLRTRSTYRGMPQHGGSNGIFEKVARCRFSGNSTVAATRHSIIRSTMGALGRLVLRDLRPELPSVSAAVRLPVHMARAELRFTDMRRAMTLTPIKPGSRVMVRAISMAAQVNTATTDSGYMDCATDGRYQPDRLQRLLNKRETIEQAGVFTAPPFLGGSRDNRARLAGK